MKRIVGVNDEEVPPVPIPNTVVKLLGAENTWLATARENRAMPTFSFFIPKNKRDDHAIVSCFLIVRVENATRCLLDVVLY